MSHEGSVTQWLRDLKDGDELAAAKLWERYYHRMRGLADKQLGGVRRTVADEDDAVLGAFADFCEQAKSDGFKQGLENRDELWQVLALVVKRKAIDQFRKVRRRGEEGESRIQGINDSQSFCLDKVLDSGEASPDAIVEAMDEINRMLQMLPDEQSRQFARLRLEGYNNHEIARQLGCALRTVERRVGQIKERWAKEYGVRTND